MQHVMNNGALMHTPFGPIQMGLNIMDKKKWDEMKKMPMVKAAMAGKTPRLKECEAPKAQPKPDTKGK